MDTAASTALHSWPWRASTLRLADEERLASATRDGLPCISYSYTSLLLLPGRKSTQCWAGRCISGIPPTPSTSSVQPGRASGRLLGRAHADGPRPR